MKWIKYQIVCGKNENNEDVLLNKKVGYSAENLAIAEVEAYDGYEIVEDAESFDKEPIAVEFGGTGANNADDARKNLGVLAADDYDGLIIKTGNFVQAELKSGRGISVVTTLELQQAGSGDPYPARGGRNLLNLAATPGEAPFPNYTFDAQTGAYVLENSAAYDANRWRVTVPANTDLIVSISEYLPSENIVIQGARQLQGDTTTPEIFRLAGTNVKELMFNSGEHTEITVSIYTSVAQTITVKGLMIRLASETDATYAPYSNIRPVTGYDVLKLGAAGKNLLPNVVESANYDDIALTKNPDGSVYVKGACTEERLLTICGGGTENVIGVDGCYVAASPGFGVMVARANGATDYFGSDSFYLAPGDKVTWVYFHFHPGEVWDQTVYPQIELGTETTSYEPYRGKLHTVQIGQTVYGGKFDWLTGKLTVTDILRTYNGNEGWFSNSGADDSLFAISLDATVNSVSVCSHTPVVNEVVPQSTICCGYYNEYGVLYLNLTGVQKISIEDFKAKLAASPVQIVYKLATPVEIQLDSLGVIESLEGINTVYGDGDLEVTFNHDIALLNKILTLGPEDVGALPITGGTVNGSLQTNEDEKFKFFAVNRKFSDMLLSAQLYVSDEGKAYLVFAKNGVPANALFLNDDNTVFIKPVAIESGGTGADNAAQARANLGITPENIGALPANGGELPELIMTSPGWPVMRFKNSAKNEIVGAVACNAVERIGQAPKVYITLKLHSYNSATGEDTGHYEDYNLPPCDVDRTTSTNYDLLTTKKAVEIHQGGTGANDAAQALQNLGIIYSAEQPTYQAGAIWLKPVE